MKALSSLLAGLLVMACLTPLTLTAQPQRGQRPGPNPEVRAYLEQEVLPVMKAQREALDTYLSPADQAEVATLRTELKALRQTMRSQREAFRGGQEKGSRPDLTPEQRSQMRDLRDQHLALQDRAEDLAFAYEEEIRTLLDAIKPQAETWREDLDELTGSDRPARPAGAPAGRPPRGSHPGMAHPGMGHPGRMSELGPLRFLNPVGFLLWDPSAPMPVPPLLDERDNLSVTPNPTSNAVTVDFDVAASGPVHIRVLSPSGEVVRDLDAGERAPGRHSQALQLGDLLPGVYVIQVLTTQGAQSQKVKVE